MSPSSGSDEASGSPRAAVRRVRTVNMPLAKCQEGDANESKEPDANRRRTTG